MLSMQNGTKVTYLRKPLRVDLEPMPEGLRERLWWWLRTSVGGPRLFVEPRQKPAEFAAVVYGGGRSISDIYSDLRELTRCE